MDGASWLAKNRASVAMSNRQKAKSQVVDVTAIIV